MSGENEEDIGRRGKKLEYAIWYNLEKIAYKRVRYCWPVIDRIEENQGHNVTGIFSMR